MKKLLAEKDQKQKDLEKELNAAIESVNEMEAELELAKALAGEMEELKSKLDKAQDSSVSPSNPLPNEERMALQGEIDRQKEEINKLKTQIDEGSDSLPDPVEGQRLASLQAQLQDAVAESVEMQTELEETKRRLAMIEAEDSASRGPQSPEFQKVLSDAKNAEEQGQIRIAELTQALRESEGLRKEMESLLPQIQVAPAPQPAPAPPLNIAADPRFIEIQKEMLLLQQDLFGGRQGLKDPESGSLQAELASTQADNAKLNEEFKNAMEDFGRIKEQLSILEDENQRLQTEGLSEARTKAEQDLLALQTKIGDLSSENSNLRVQLGERENRISGLRDELARAKSKFPASPLTTQLWLKS